MTYFYFTNLEQMNYNLTKILYYLIQQKKILLQECYMITYMKKIENF